MAIEAKHAAFSFSAAVLLQLSAQKKNFAERDTARFGSYNITPGWLSAMEQKANVLADHKTDSELTGDQVTATQTKDALAEQLRQAIRPILTRAFNKYGPESGTYRKFGSKGLSDMNDLALSNCARTTVRVAASLMPDLSSEGLTMEMIDEVNCLQKALDKAMADRDDAIANREIAAEERIAMGNALYADLVKLCAIGKEIWAYSNEARYNDYIIYNTSTGSKEVTEPTPEAVIL